MIHARDLTVSLSGRPVLKGLSIGIEAGRLTAIAGPNGSGKSTLLRTLAGELRYDGELFIWGTSLRNQSPAALALRRGVLPQSSESAFPFTVAEIVGFGLEAGARGRREDAGLHVARALDRVGLSGLAHRNYQELSGGEQQRAQLARVLCQIPEPVAADGTPRLLLLDEPVASLDIRHQLEIMALARDFAGKGGAVVAVMHDLNLTALFADDLLLMRDGRLVATGPVREVMTDPVLEKVYGCRLRVNAVPERGVPFVLAQSVA